MFTKKMLNMVTGFFVMAGVLGPAIALGSPFPHQGIYKGSIKLNDGGSISLSFSLKYSDQETQNPPDEMAGFKRKMIGAFTIDGEAGPYGFSYVNYDWGQSRIEMIYSRRETPQLTSLQFLGRYSSQGEITGTVGDSHNIIGTFAVSFSQKDNQTSSADSRFTGAFEGTLAFTVPPAGEASVIPLSFTLSLSGTTVATPLSWDLDSSPGRAGGFVFNSWDAGFDSVIINYFDHDTIVMTYAEGSSTLTFFGVPFTENGRLGLKGYANSSKGGRLGLFTVYKKEVSP